MSKNFEEIYGDDVENRDITIFDNGWDSKKSRVLQISVDEENEKNSRL